MTPTTDNTDQDSTRGRTHWLIPLSALAVAASVFGLSCLTVLVIVASVDGSNALSTVALALAILAFSVQLIVFIAQEGTARRQELRNEGLHGSMRGLLGEIREKAAGTQADVRIISEKLLEAILTKSVTDAQGSEGDIDYRRLATDIATLAQSTPSVVQPDQSDEADDGTPWPPRRPTSQDSSIREQLRTFPSADEVGDSFDILKTLSPSGRKRLKAFGQDEFLNRRPDAPFDPALSSMGADELRDKGLVEPLPEFGEMQLMHLTDRGREIARLLTAPGDPPDHLPSLAELRDDTPDSYPEWRRVDEIAD